MQISATLDVSGDPGITIALSNRRQRNPLKLRKMRAFSSVPGGCISTHYESRCSSKLN